MNKKQKDIILQCAIDICTTCDNRGICQDVLECNTRMTLECLADGFKYVTTYGESFGTTEKIKKFSGDSPFELAYEVI
ncbi:hypothetical protein [Terrisporobacter petrolearius]|uniref:hypothetical protein n=1 Tax=Terrisporobacter petrolearius TaxID=1460447 RepID=UPI0031CC7B38